MSYITYGKYRDGTDIHHGAFVTWVEGETVHTGLTIGATIGGLTVITDAGNIMHDVAAKELTEIPDPATAHHAEHAAVHRELCAAALGDHVSDDAIQAEVARRELARSAQVPGGQPAATTSASVPNAGRQYTYPLGS